MLLKYRFTSVTDYNEDIKNGKLRLHPSLINYIDKHMGSLPQNTIVYTNTYEVITSNDYNKRIPIYYNLKIDEENNIDYNTYHNAYSSICKKNTLQIYKSPLSFDQNNIYISSKLRNAVITFITESSLHIMNDTDIKRVLLGIGGEYYVYHILAKKFGYKKYIGFTNNADIQTDAVYNYDLHSMETKAQSYFMSSYIQFLIEYQHELDFNLDDIIDELTQTNYKLDIIINLSKLNVNVLQFIVRLKKNINTVTFISCNECDFITKMQLMPEAFTTYMKSLDFKDEFMGQTVTVYHTRFM
jgi:hypothetical protein